MTRAEMIDDVANILISALDRETVDKFVEDENGNLIAIETYSLYEVAKQIIGAGYGKVDEYKAEFERLRQEVRDTDKIARNSIEQFQDDYDKAFERLKFQQREIEQLKEENKQAKIEVLERVKRESRGVYPEYIPEIIDKLIEEVKAE